MPNTPTTPTTPASPSTPAAPAPGRRGEPALILCAMAMALILGVLLAPVLQQPARAEMVSESGALVALTARGGNEEILFLLDNRTEQLAVYRVFNQNSLQLLQQVELPDAFEAARAKRLGRE